MMKVSMTSKQRKVYNQVTPMFDWNIDEHGVIWRDILRLRKLLKTGGKFDLAFVQPINPEELVKVNTKLANQFLSDEPVDLADAVNFLKNNPYIITVQGYEPATRDFAPKPEPKVEEPVVPQPEAPKSEEKKPEAPKKGKGKK